jgi:hypothetical protein
VLVEFTWTGFGTFMFGLLVILVIVGVSRGAVKALTLLRIGLQDFVDLHSAPDPEFVAGDLGTRLGVCNAE